MKYERWRKYPWCVKSKRSGQIIHHSTTRKGAENWREKFFKTHGEVIRTPGGDNNNDQ